MSNDFEQQINAYLLEQLKKDLTPEQTNDLKYKVKVIRELKKD